MNIAYHCSDAYARILGVSLASLFENNIYTDEINIYIIERRISDKNKKALNSIAEQYCRKIIYIPMPDINKKEHLSLKKVKKKWMFDSYCRLYLDDLLPEELEKVLYLDSDVLVTDSLDMLWKTDLKNHCVAGVKDCFGDNYYKLLGLKENSSYCNSGVLLINLVQWKKEKIGYQVREYLKTHNGYVFFMEQTTLNGIIQDRWFILDPRYNVNTLMMMLNYDEIDKLRHIKDNFYDKETVEKAVLAPAIIHMTSVFLVHNRTWIENNNHPAEALYKKYKKLTPWKEESDIPDNRSFLIKFKDRIIDIMPRSLLISGVSVIYNRFRIVSIKRKMIKYSK